MFDSQSFISAAWDLGSFLGLALVVEEYELGRAKACLAGGVEALARVLCAQGTHCPGRAFSDYSLVVPVVSCN